MDASNNEALSYGPDYMLAKFANLPAEKADVNPAVEFQRRFGMLFPGVAPGSYWRLVKHFRAAWHAKTRDELQAVGSHLESIFNRIFCRRRLLNSESGLSWQGALAGPQDMMDGEVRHYPALRIDFASGRISLKPHATLLDWLAESLLESRHRLGICEREGCPTPYFVKTHPRARYCSEHCFRESRLEKKNQWWKRNRGKDSKHSARNRAATTKAKNSARRGRR
jgi:hypothetical protein